VKLSRTRQTLRRIALGKDKQGQGQQATHGVT